MNKFDETYKNIIKEDSASIENNYRCDMKARKFSFNWYRFIFTYQYDVSCKSANDFQNALYEIERKMLDDMYVIEDVTDNVVFREELEVKKIQYNYIEVQLEYIPGERVDVDRVRKNLLEMGFVSD